MVCKADQLPEELKEFAFRNGLNVHHASFHADLGRLIRELKGQVVAPRQSLYMPVSTSAPSARQPLAGGLPDRLRGISAKHEVNATEGDLTRAPAFPDQGGRGH